MSDLPFSEKESSKESCAAISYLVKHHRKHAAQLWDDLFNKASEFPPKERDHYLTLAAKSWAQQNTSTVNEPSMEYKPQEGSPDIILYVALYEEFLELLKQIGYATELRVVEDSQLFLTYYLWDINTSDAERTYTIAIVSPGSMGSDKASSIVSTLLTRWREADVVVLGIAGTISDDLGPGDVFVPSIVKGYLINSAAVNPDNMGKEDEDEAFEFQTSGEDIKCSKRLVDRLRHFGTNPQTAELYNSYEASINERKKNSKTEFDLELLAKFGMSISDSVKITVGEDLKLASGPAVGKARSFAKWLKLKDRKFTAMEMESIGALIAGELFDPSPRILVIRGISDMATDKKNEFEEATCNRFRAISLENAAELFISAVKANIFR